MIVLDASAVLELLLSTSAGRRVASRIADPGIALHVPHLVDVEVTQALRRYEANDEIDAPDAARAIAALRELPLERHGHEVLLDRVWAIRRNVSAYDAVCVALAEALSAVLLTCDRKLARAPGVMAQIELIEG